MLRGNNIGTNILIYENLKNLKNKIFIQTIIILHICQKLRTELSF